MKVVIDCVPCYLRQAVNCMGIAGVDEETQHRILYDLMNDIKAFDRNRTPAENSTELLLTIYDKIKNNDPYREIKERSNDLAMSLYPKLKDYLSRSNDPIRDSLKISASGNIIDLGISKSFDLDRSLHDSLHTGFTRDDSDLFLAALRAAEKVVILGDNAGEIVFDRLLAEELSRLGKSVTYVVKGGPILNDATIADAVQAGMDRTAALVTTGTNYLGFPLARVSREARKLLGDADLVVAKGHANFESLEHEAAARGRVFFLLKIKCESVGKVAGASLGDIVFLTRGNVAGAPSGRP